MTLYLILHKVRGEPAFDIAQMLEPPPHWTGAREIWIIPTSGHRAYPYRKWPLDDLADISDINLDGFHDRPASFDHTLPPNWPDHYQVNPPAKPAVPTPQSASQTSIEDLLI